MRSTQSYLTDALAAISERTKQQLDNGTLTTAYNLLTFPEKNRKKHFLESCNFQLLANIIVSIGEPFYDVYTGDNVSFAMTNWKLDPREP